MASAVLATRNETNWGDRKVYMRKHTTITTPSNKNSNFLYDDPIPNSDPTPRYSSKPHKQAQIHDPPSSYPHFRRREPSPPPEKRSPCRKPVSFSEVKESSHGGYITFNLSACTRRELKELKRRLLSELEQVRVLKTRLDELTFEARPVYSPAQLTVRPPPPSPFQLTDVATNLPSLKQPQKRTPKPTQPKKKCLGSGSKRGNPFSQNSNPKRPAMDPLTEKVLISMMKRCGQILMKLMKHKFAWVFNKPVDTVALGLFDYHQIIKKPMDLGTVKLNLDKGVYKSPMEFATDVRLTFDNAMTYNHKETDVHIMAQKLFGMFNEMFDPAYKKFENEKLRISRLGQNPVQFPPKLVSQVSVQPVQTVEKAVQVVEPPRVGKLPKPKAKDLNKREMSFEEKSKLGKELEELPQEKMLQVLHIVNKRNGHLVQEGDEFELDMEVMDIETLWELDRFVTNYKKSASKNKRQGLIQNQVTPAQFTLSPVSEMVDVEDKEEKAGEEEVDIGDEIPVISYPPVEIEKDVTACASCKSSSSGGSGSSSDSSSSSDSGSASSSGSDSDADSVQSPYVDGNSNIVQVN